MSANQGAGPRIEALITEAPIGMALFDESFRCLAHSRLWLDHVGRAQEPSLVGRCHLELWPERRAEWEEVLARCLAGETVRRERDRAPGPGGEELRWQARPWRDEDGAAVGLMIYSESIAEELATRRQLAESRRFFESFFEESTVGLNLCRMDGLWIESNPAFLTIIGYSREEADGGLTYWQLTPDEYAEQEKEQLLSLEATGRYGPYEKEFIRKDGRRVPVRLNGFLLERDGERYIWSLIEDITSERRQERERESMRRQVMVSSRLASLGTLAAGIAHEVNNPLTIIYGYLELLEKNLAGGRAVDLSVFGTLFHSIERIKQIIGELNAYARPPGASTAPFDCHEAIKRLLQLLRSIYAVDAIRIDARLEARGSLVLGEPSRFQQVLMNLLSNARDAVADQSDKRIEVRSQDRGDRLLVSVKDNGCGIPEEQIDKIFDTFFTTKEIGKGTGLGLGISYSIIREMGGEISVSSVEGSGTTFSIELPRAGISSTEETALSAPVRCSRVLVVDDEPLILDLLRDVMVGEGLTVETALDGKEALRLLEEDDFDLLVTDWRLPGLSGLELIEALRARGMAMDVLLITGELEDRVQSSVDVDRLKIAGVLSKPFSTEELSRRIRALLSKQRAAVDERKG